MHVICFVCFFLQYDKADLNPPIIFIRIRDILTHNKLKHNSYNTVIFSSQPPLTQDLDEEEDPINPRKVKVTPLN